MLNEDDNMVGTDHEMPPNIDNTDNEYGGFVRNDSGSGITSTSTTSGTSSVCGSRKTSTSLILAANIVSTSRGKTEIQENKEIVDQIIQENIVDNSMKIQDQKVDDIYEKNVETGEIGNVRVKFLPESEPAMSLPSSGEDTQKLDDNLTESESVSIGSLNETDIEIDNNEQKLIAKEKIDVILDSGRRELEDPPLDTSIKLEAMLLDGSTGSSDNFSNLANATPNVTLPAAVKVASASMAAPNIHSYHSNIFLPFSMIPQNELPDTCDFAVDAILALLQPQKAQEVYRFITYAVLNEFICFT
jgi:hypothetical protein